MENEPANMTITFPPDYPWQHIVLEGDEESRVRVHADAGSLPANTDAGPAGAPASPATEA